MVFQKLESLFYTIETNYNISQLSASSDADWLEMSIEPCYYSSKQNEKKIRFVSGKEADFKSTAQEQNLRLRITNDFVMELLSRSRSLTVIRPLHLRERVRKVYEEALKRNI